MRNYFHSCFILCGAFFSVANTKPVTGGGGVGGVGGGGRTKLSGGDNFNKYKCDLELAT